MTSKLRHIFILLTILNIGLPLMAQNKTVDSLKLVLKNAKHDTTRISISIAIGELIYSTELKTALDLFVNAKNICEKHIASNITLETIPKTFYLIHLSDALNNIGFLSHEQGYDLKALEYYQKSLKIGEEIKYKKAITFSLSNIGIIYANKGDLPKAIDYYLRSAKIHEEINNKKEIARSLNNIGFIYEDQGDLQKALEYYHKCLKIEEETKDNLGLTSTLNSIAFIYRDQGDFPKALEYYHKSLKILEEMKDKERIASTLNYIGIIYKKQGDIPKTLECFNKSLKINEEIKNQKGITYTLNNIGFIYKDQGNITEALKYFKKSLKIREEIKDKKGITYSLNNIAGAMLQKGQVDGARNYAVRSLKIAKELGYPEMIKDVANTLKTIYERQNNFKEAFVMYELQVVMRDSMSNTETKKASIRKTFQYEYEKKAAADSVKHAEEQKVKNALLTAQKAQLKQEKTQRLALYGGLVLVIAFLGFVFNRFKITQKQKVIIEQQKVLVDDAFKHLEEKNKEVMDSIHYAKRIQTALMSNEKYIAKTLEKLSGNSKT